MQIVIENGKDDKVFEEENKIFVFRSLFDGNENDKIVFVEGNWKYLSSVVELIEIFWIEEGFVEIYYQYLLCGDYDVEIMLFNFYQMLQQFLFVVDIYYLYMEFVRLNINF